MKAVDAGMVRVWDPLVRIGHWTLVVAFFVAYFTEDDLLTVHTWAGYVVGAVVVLRVLWGFAGPPHARFSDFSYRPSVALRYVLDLLRFRAKRYLGHTPGGGMMIYAMLVCLAVTVGSGIVALAQEHNSGPLAGIAAAVGASRPVAGGVLVRMALADEHEVGRDHGDRGEKRESVWGEVHEFFSSLTLWLVVVHIAAVALASIVHRENLVRSMVTGLKRIEP